MTVTTEAMFERADLLGAGRMPAPRRGGADRSASPVRDGAAGSVSPGPVAPARGGSASPVRGGRPASPAVRRGRGTGQPPAASPPTSREALALLRQAAEGLAEGHREADPLHRYPAAYLAALRAGAAVLAMRARPRPRRGAPRDVWQLLAEVAPELGEWAAFFASCSRTRAAAEAGISRLVSRRDADDLLRQAEQFVGQVSAVIPLR